jgi:predicted nuclease with TOPRIM domain
MDYKSDVQRLESEVELNKEKVKKLETSNKQLNLKTNGLKGDVKGKKQDGNGNASGDEEEEDFFDANLNLQMNRRFSEMPRKMEKKITITEEQKNVFI